MSVYVYPTDHRWYDYLSGRRQLDEVNFWQPSGNQVFRRLQPGDLFLFRLKSPINRIAGGGVFAHSSLFPIKAAWDAFGEKNGVPSYSTFFDFIQGYRGKNGERLRDDSPIGCIILQNPFFADRSQWLRVPSDFSLNLVQGRRYDAGDETTSSLKAWALHAMRDSMVAEQPLIIPAVDGPIYGDPVLVKRRLGQGTFRVLVSDAYDRRCALTGEKTLPVLEAAHIKPVSQGGEHRIDNGLLLRSDIHKLFDIGYVSFSPTGSAMVSPKLKETWLNGRIYYDLHGKELRLPSAEQMRPSRAFLEWHNDERYIR